MTCGFVTTHGAPRLKTGSYESLMFLTGAKSNNSQSTKASKISPSSNASRAAAVKASKSQVKNESVVKRVRREQRRTHLLIAGLIHQCLLLKPQRA